MEASSIVSDLFKVTRVLGGVVENAKVNVNTLYLRQIPSGNPGANQLVVIPDPKDETRLGETGVNNWVVYDGPGPEANRVANGQGMYTRAGKWNQWFTLEFNNKVDQRYKWSTLQVMGGNDDKENEWAIVGGTGEFAMAHGIIKRRLYSLIGGITQELTMEFFCRMKVPTPTRRGPWGGNGGSLHEMGGKSQRLVSVTINHGGLVHAIGFSYIDEDGQIHTAGVWGEIRNNAPDKTETIKFDPSEFVKQITGTGTAENPSYLSKFQIVTNHTKYGPFGTRDDGVRFSYPVPEGETVVGFFANVGRWVQKIGVYTI